MAGKLTPHIYSEDARTQAEFYKSALGGEIQAITTFEQVPGTPEANKDKVMHLRLVVAGGNEIFFADVFQPINQGQNISMAISFDTEAEARDAFTNLAVGGNVKYPFEQQPWGAFYGEVQDKFDIIWQVVKQL